MKPAIVLLLAAPLLAQQGAQQLVQCLAVGDFASAVRNFDSTMKSKLPEHKLRTAWTSLTDQVGPFRRQLGVKTEKVQGHDVANVKCEFANATLTIRVVLNSSRQVAGLFFLPAEVEYQPPAYVHPSSFQDREVLFGIENWMVHGTVSIPAGLGPFPAVVLVHGSGPQDRDETIGPNKPFRDLAYGLASHRIAVLRYEKRTLEHKVTAAAVNNLTVREETIDDALAAVNVLRHTEHVDASRIFVLGHSLGGMLLPWIGKSDPQIAGLVVMAGPTRPMEDAIVDQYAYLSSIGEASSRDLAKVQAQAVRVKDPRLSSATPKEDLPFGIPAAYWLALRAYNPPETARRLSQPMLILEGERDYQVTMQDFDGWKSALSGRKNVTLKTYPDLNHLFMEGAGKSRPAEYQKPGHVQERVIEDISNWINERK